MSINNLIKVYEEIITNDTYLLQAHNILSKEMHKNPNFF